MIRKESLPFALMAASLGLGVGLLIQKIAIGDYSGFFYFSATSAFVSSYVIWYFLMEKGHHRSLIRGMVAGMINVIVAHYLCFYFFLLKANIEYWVFGMEIHPLGGPPIDPLLGIEASALYATISYLLIGWLTIPAGTLLGVFYTRWLRNRRP